MPEHLGKRPSPARRKHSAGGGEYQEASFYARELAPNGDSLSHTHILVTPGSPATLRKPCRDFFHKAKPTPNPLLTLACWLPAAPLGGPGWLGRGRRLPHAGALLGPGLPPAAGSSRPPCSSASSRSPWPEPGSPLVKHVCPPVPACSPSFGPGVGRRSLVPPTATTPPSRPWAAFSLLPHVTNLTVKGKIVRTRIFLILIIFTRFLTIRFYKAHLRRCQSPATHQPELQSGLRLGGSVG